MTLRAFRVFTAGFAVTVAGLTFSTSAFAEDSHTYEYAAPLNCNPYAAKTSDTAFYILNDAAKADSISVVHMLDQESGNQVLPGDLTVGAEQSKSVSCRDIMRQHRHLASGGSSTGFNGFTRISSNVPLTITATYTIDSSYSKALDVYPVPQTKGPNSGGGGITPPPPPPPPLKLDDWVSCDPGGKFESASSRPVMMPTSIAGGSSAFSQYTRKDRSMHNWTDNRRMGVASTGRTSPEGVIVGGDRVQYKWEYPWMAHLQINFNYVNGELRTFNCGASLIAEQWLVTAAHCVSVKDFEARYGDKADLHSIRVGMGALDVRSLEHFKATQTLCHKGYNGQVSLDDDIALIKLDRPVTLRQDSIEIGEMATSSRQDDVFVGAATYPTGWGTADNDRQSPELLKIKLEASNVDPKRFQAMKDPRFANASYGSVCFGDSGGPIHTQDSSDSNSGKKIVGVSSYVIRGDEATPQDPGCRFMSVISGFTRVSGYAPQIQTALDVCSSENSTCFD